MKARSQTRILIACIGNSLASDDAAGCEVYERLNRDLPPDDVRLEMLGVEGLSLLEILNGEERVIVVDSVRLGGAPGTVHVLDWEELGESGGKGCSIHDIGIREAFLIADRLFPELMPESLVLVGIEGERFNEVGGLSPAVSASIDSVVEIVEKMAMFPNATAES